MKIEIPDFALVVLIGASGSGKSSFARRHFLPTEIVSSDECRAMIVDDENDLAVTADAFALLHEIAGRRLAWRRLTVIDATSVQHRAREPLVALARAHHALAAAIVLDMPEALCRARNEERPDRDFGPHVIRNQRQQLRRSLRHLRKEGFTRVHHLTSPEEVDAVEIVRRPLWPDRRDERGPFDIIGDLHGCTDELETLLDRLGYEWTVGSEDPLRPYRRRYAHPEGRRAIFLGDLVDRGPRVLDAIQLVRNMVDDGQALALPGNHDVKLARRLRGRNVRVRYGMAESLAEIEALPDEIRTEFARDTADWLESLVSHYVLDGGALVVAHAGMKETLQNRASRVVRDFALYGETTGESDEYGLPIRYPWAQQYRGDAVVVYGHTPVPRAEWLNNTINIDTGCVFGGALTALRYPERELVSVPAARTYADPIRPLAERGSAGPPLLDIADVTGKRVVETTLRGNITVQPENAAAALEVMSRYAADPRWLIYLPPTMSPTTTSAREGLLEHPDEAFAYYRERGIRRLLCEEKHMGSRAVVVLCRDEAAAGRRFGVEGERGIVLTRSGRRFFEADEHERGLLDELGAALEASDFWARHGTDWLCLDAELMPWSAKAQALLREQYAAVGAAATAALEAAGEQRAVAAARGLDVDEWLHSATARAARVAAYIDAYRHYCWPVESVADLRLAPFHLLATEGHVHSDKPHPWHLEEIAQIVAAGGDILQMTTFRAVELDDPSSVAGAIAWWETLTAAGGEGMVVKPEAFVPRGRRGLLQPAIKCRGRDYLRLIYGPEYTAPENLVRLRKRSVSAKRSLALREFALGLESLDRFVRREPLYRVHEPVFALLALESEPVDPRL